MRKLILGILILAMVGVAVYVYEGQDAVDSVVKNPDRITEPNEEVQEESNYSARFEIYTKGTKRIFTDAMYHNLSEDVYIAKDDPSVVYVEKSGVTWGEFFNTLPLSLGEECLVTGTGQRFCDGEGGQLMFYLNNEIVSGVLSREIREGDELVVRFE